MERDEASVTTIRRVGDVVVVSPAGELDMAAALGFTVAVEGARRESSSIVVDLREVTFIDSMGVRAIIQAAGGLDGGSTVGFVRPPERVQRTLAIAGIDEALM